MQNRTVVSINATSPKTFSVIIKVCVVIPFFCVFLCFVAIMLQIVASHRQFLDTSRYILFAHLLINDTIHIVCSVLTFLTLMGQVKLPLLFCVPLFFVSTGTFLNTTLILAAMSLERYVAIFYPLHRPASWRSDRVWIITLPLWIISFIFPITEYFIGKDGQSVDVLSTNMLCKNTVINSSPVHELYRLAMNVLSFAVVGVIILFTYVRILMETRKMRQDRASVSKAMHTVLLHGFQLLLCLLGFTQPIFITLIGLHTKWLGEDIVFLNFFCFILIPRFLSPLIYGFRDQSLRKHIGSWFLCCSKKGKPFFK